MTPDIVKLRELAGNAREMSADHQKPGVWMHLFGDRFVYTRLEDGCRGRSVVGVDCIRNGGDNIALDFVAAANPATIIALIDALEAANKRIAELEKAQQIAAQIMINSAQILDVVKGEWTKDNSWSTWDQSVRDSYTVFLRAAESNNKKPATSDGAG